MMTKERKDHDDKLTCIISILYYLHCFVWHLVTVFALITPPPQRWNLGEIGPHLFLPMKAFFRFLPAAKPAGLVEADSSFFLS